MDGEWYEIGSAYLEEIAAAVAGLFPSAPCFDLPVWKQGDSENEYNALAKACGWICLDTKNVANPMRRTDQVEICDLVTDENTLVLVKRADSSRPLSRLFSQARVAVELLYESDDVRAQFAAMVLKESDNEHTLPEDFTPKRVVIAILRKNREERTPESILGFSQITIAQTAEALATRGVTVEVVGISSTT
ncbi:hypothetical protein SCHAM137S_07775 [Streptomyces chartreusis]